jgi:hypothetical protein
MATKLKASAKTVTQPVAQPQRKSNAQRQADYRARHLKDENGQLQRLSLLVDLHAKRALERLASCYGVTQREMLERLLMQANRLAQEQIAQQSPDGHAAYFDKRISLQWPVVTR